VLANWPAGSLHIMCPEMQAATSGTLFEITHKNQQIVAADNGILTYAFEDRVNEIMPVFETTKPSTNLGWIDTFVGAAVAMQEQDQQKKFSGNRTGNHHSNRSPRIVSGFNSIYRQNNYLECSIIYIDRYGNVTLNLDRDRFGEYIGDKKFRIDVSFNSRIDVLSNSYSDVPQDQPLIRFNNSGFLEMALNRKSMAVKMNLHRLSSADLLYKKVRIVLEGQ